MNQGIYAIINMTNLHRYIGSSTMIRKRWWKHKKQLTDGTHANKHLQNAWNLYGAQAFIFVVLERVENRDDLVAREQHYLDELKPEYNIRTTAENNRGITRESPSKEAIQKRTETRRKNGWYKDPEQAFENRSKAMKGRTFSPETREKMRLAKLGNKNRLGGRKVE